MKLSKALSIKGAVLDRYQLELYLEKIASDHSIQKQSDKSTYPIYAVLKSFDFITKTYDILNRDLKLGINIHPAGEWLLDNFYIIEEAVKNVVGELSLKKYTRFLGIANGQYKGYARIYVLASEIVGYTDGNINGEDLSSLLKAYQKKKTLNMEEIWSINVFLNIALIENIKLVCEKIYSSELQKYRVESILERLLDKKNHKEQIFKLNAKYKFLGYGQLKYPFIEYMSYKLKKYGKQASIYFDILEEQVNKMGTNIAEVIKKEHFDMALKKVSIGNSIRSIKALQTINFLDLFEEINGVEEILKCDPTDVFSKMDYKTKSYYRNAIKEISKLTKVSEIYIAQKALELAANESNTKKRHIGYYLISNGKTELLSNLGMNKKVFFSEKKKADLYIFAFVFVTILISVLLGWGYTNKLVGALKLVGIIIISLLMVIPISEIVTQVFQYFLGKVVKPKLIPKLDFYNGVPKEFTTMVVIPTILDNSKKVKELIEKLEVFYLANKSENIFFTLLGDCTSAQEEKLQIDEEIIKTGIEEIEKLNGKNPLQKMQRFNFVYRKRHWNESENAYLGWERKRGLLTQFNEFLRGSKESDFRVNTFFNQIPEIKYIITLDADTDLTLNSGLELIGAMAHILNEPIIENGIVVDGYGIMQPRVGVSLPASRKTLFTKIFASDGGTDLYANAISDIYQDNFGEGIYTGKGIYDLNVFSKVLEGEIPENTVLSHDLLEGNYLRCGLVSDVLLLDGYPYKYSAYIKRLHRWIRGDWQIINWLKSQLNRLSKFKILDNLRRSLLGVSIISNLLIFGLLYLFLDFKTLGLAIISVISVMTSVILNLINYIVFKKDKLKKQKTFEKTISGLKASFLETIINVAVIPDKAYTSANAIIKTLYRKFYSKKNLLEWCTAEEAEKQSKNTLQSYFKGMGANFVFGILAIFFAMYEHNLTSILAYILGVLWLTAPCFMWYISRIVKEKNKLAELSNDEIDYILRIGKDTWQFFFEYMNEENNYLPPDNFQEDRKQKVVDRTSSTNIGLGLLAVVSAYDLGYLEFNKAIDLIQKILETIEKLPKWNGHLYNWYNIKTLKPLIPRYVSSVDSGNFVGYLYTLKQFFQSEMEVRKSEFDYLILKIDELIRNTDFSVLYDEKKRLFSIGFNIEENKLTESYYDLLASEARQASLVAISQKQVSPKHWSSLSRTLTVLDNYKGLISWSGTAFEYLMPNINIKKYKGSLLDESSKFMIMCQKKYAKKLGIPWGISESAFNLKDLNSNYQYKAFGIPWLGLKRGLADEMVVATYGSVLAITEVPKEVVKNLKLLEKEGMYNKYGLYEAVDFTPSRLHYGRTSQPVKTYMAHHQALILLSINNLMNNNILQNRFMKNPEIQAIDVLLQERMPERALITKERKEKVEKIKYVGYDNYFEETFTKPNDVLKICNVISNDNYLICIDDRGDGFSKYRDILINRYKETNDFSQGINFYIKNIRTKKIWTNNFVKGLKSPDKYIVNFSPDMAKFTRNDENIETTTKITVASNENVEIRNVEIKNNSNIEELIEVTSFLEPVISTSGQDNAHPAFNNLFLRYELKDDSIIITRNSRNEDSAIYLGVNLYTDVDVIGDFEYEIDKEKIYGRGNLLPKMIENSQPFSKMVGLVTDPCIAIRKVIKIKPLESVNLNLIISISENKEEVLQNLLNYKNIEKVKREFELSRARIEEETRYLGITSKDLKNYQKIIAYLIFQNPIKKLYVTDEKYLNTEIWKYGISGDLPIMLLTIKDVNSLDIVEEVLKAYEYLRLKNINIDLVILDEEENSYEKFVKDAVQSEILNKQLGYVQNISGGIFLLSSQDVENKELFITRANLVIRASEGDLTTILNDLEHEYYEVEGKNYLETNELRLTQTQINAGTDLQNLVPSFADLKYYNEYGGFSQDGTEYIIKVNKENNLPVVWSHILANKKFGTVVTQHGSGFTWSENSRLNRLTAWSNNAIIDPPSEIFYLKDLESGSVYSLCNNLYNFDSDINVIYGFGYAKYQSSALGIFNELEVFVPNEDSVKINILRLKNTQPIKRKVRIVYYTKPVLAEDEIQSNGYISLKFNNNVLQAENAYGSGLSGIMYVSTSEKIKGYTGNKDSFFGGGTLLMPDALRKEKLDNKNGLGGNSCIAIEFEIELEALEDKEFAVVLGEEKSEIEVKNIAYKYSKVSKCKEALQEVKNYWRDMVNVIQVKTPVESMNIMMNGWIVYQTIVSRLWAKSAFYQSGGATGYRDQLQDSMGIKYVSKEFMEKQILEQASHQFVQGDVLHWWHKETGKGIRTRFSDDLLWLVYVVLEYIELTDNQEFLNFKVPYLTGEILPEGEDERYDIYEKSEISETIYEHCKRAINRAIVLGKNELPKIGSGDWNDGFSTVGNKGSGESVWLGFFLYSILDRFVKVCENRGDLEIAKLYEEIKQKIKKAVNTVGWDGRWYKRAFTDEGQVLGSIENEECRIDNISQSWAVISNAGDNDKKFIAMESLENHLVDAGNGIIKLLDPPFEKGNLNPGYIKAYLPGVRENGGQYTHECCACGQFL